MTWLADPLNRLLIILAAALLVGAVGCWVIFRDPVDDEDEADFDADLDDYEGDEGWDDASTPRSDTATPDRHLHGEPGHSDLMQLPESRGQALAGRASANRDANTLDMAGSQGGLRGLASDWRASMIVQLAPAALAAESLPGPVLGAPMLGTGRVGEIHYMDEWLGRPGDGSEHTALRVRRDGEQWWERCEAIRRAWCEEGGIRFVPAEVRAGKLVAA